MQLSEPLLALREPEPVCRCAGVVVAVVMTGAAVTGLGMISPNRGRLAGGGRAWACAETADGLGTTSSGVWLNRLTRSCSEDCLLLYAEVVVDTGVVVVVAGVAVAVRVLLGEREKSGSPLSARLLPLPLPMLLLPGRLSLW